MESSRAADPSVAISTAIADLIEDAHLDALARTSRPITVERAQRIAQFAADLAALASAIEVVTRRQALEPFE